MHKLPNSYLLCLVTDSKLCGTNSLIEVVRSAVQGGVNLIQLREKNLSTREFLQVGRELKELLSRYQVPLIINDRIDIALALDAAGVHLGQSDMPYEIARKILGPNKIIGLTINTLTQAEQAEHLEVDYLGVGTIFPTQTKADVGKPWDISELRKLRKLSRHTLIGIGGINVSNASQVLEVGFDGIAVVSAICAAENPGTNAAQLLNIIKTTKHKIT